MLLINLKQLFETVQSFSVRDGIRRGKCRKTFRGKWDLSQIWHPDLLGAGVNGRMKVINQYLGKLQ